MSLFGRRREQDEVHSRLESLVRGIAPNLLGYFLRRVESAEDAADLVSETFLITWKKARDVPIEDLPAQKWIFGVAGNVLMNYRRGRRRHHQLADKLAAEIAGANGGHVLPVDDDVLDIRNALAALAPAQCELLTLVHWDGFSIKDAGEIIGLGASTARGRYSAALAQVRAILAPDHVTIAFAGAKHGQSGEAARS